MKIRSWVRWEPPRMSAVCWAAWLACLTVWELCTRSLLWSLLGSGQWAKLLFYKHIKLRKYDAKETPEDFRSSFTDYWVLRSMETYLRQSFAEHVRCYDTENKSESKNF